MKKTLIVGLVSGLIGIGASLFKSYADRLIKEEMIEGAVKRYLESHQ